MFSISSLLGLLVVPIDSLRIQCLQLFRHFSLKSSFKPPLSAINIFSQVNCNLLFKAWITNIVLIASVYSERFILFVVDPSLFTLSFCIVLSQIIGYSYDTFITVPNRQKLLHQIKYVSRLKFSAFFSFFYPCLYSYIYFRYFPSLVPNTVIPYVFVASIFLSTTLNCISSLIQDFLFWKISTFQFLCFPVFMPFCIFVHCIFFMATSIYLDAPL